MAKLQPYVEFKIFFLVEIARFARNFVQNETFWLYFQPLCNWRWRKTSLTFMFGLSDRINLLEPESIIVSCVCLSVTPKG